MVPLWSEDSERTLEAALRRGLERRLANAVYINAEKVLTLWGTLSLLEQVNSAVDNMYMNGNGWAPTKCYLHKQLAGWTQGPSLGLQHEDKPDVMKAGITQKSMWEGPSGTNPILGLLETRPHASNTTDWRREEYPKHT